MLAHDFNSSTWKEEADQHEFEASLIYIINPQRQTIKPACSVDYSINMQKNASKKFSNITYVKNKNFLNYSWAIA